MVQIVAVIILRSSVGFVSITALYENACHVCSLLLFSTIYWMSEKWGDGIFHDIPNILFSIGYLTPSIWTYGTEVGFRTVSYEIIN